ncbi:MAG: hypothetical protein HC836_10095 [Richelia sp. RM2_1_2]|nr:hypothetical protein [Richelia sp. SM2_1_7]NJN08004.1 hypothetical protein [Richelia sp. RM1_1_1]NJO58678.1 hypothetical protein [Richelia sp. RM2_1_2]
MKFKEIGLVLTSLTVTMIGMGINSSSAQAASFFGEDLQHFNINTVTDAPDLSTLKNSSAAEQLFLKTLVGSSVGSVNFEQSEGFTQLNQTNKAFNYDYDLKKADGNIVTMNISDPNQKNNQGLYTTIQRSGGTSGGNNTNVAGGRYGISDAGLTKQERLNNQFLNTNAGKDSNLVFSFSEAISAFGFYGTDFERGALMGVEFTRVDGSTKYLNLNLTDAQAYKDRGETIRGTAFYSGYIADSEEDYFTKVRFDIKDAQKGTNDIVAFDRMTFASAPMTNRFSQAQAVPEPSLGFLALGAVVSGAAFKRRKKV